MTILESLKGAKSCTDALNLLRAGGELVKYRYSFPYHFGVSFGDHKLSLKPEDGVIRLTFYESFFIHDQSLIDETSNTKSFRRSKFDLALDGWEELQKFVKGIKPAKRVAV